MACLLSVLWITDAQNEHVTDVAPKRPLESPIVNATEGTIAAPLLAREVFHIKEDNVETRESSGVLKYGIFCTLKLSPNQKC